MSDRHFRARVPGPPKTDIRLTSTYAGTTARPLTEKGRVFLSRYYIVPADYVDQHIEIDPGRFWQTFKAALRAQGLRAKYDYTGNHREVE